MTKRSRVVAIVSGGMDSVTLAHLLALRFDVTILSVNYGQRHAKELDFAAACAERLDAPHHVVDLTSLTQLLTGSALTDRSIPVPHGHYEDETMRATVVPNRNATMLDLAVAVAVSEGAAAVGTGVHAGDHAVYPDCRPEFILAFEACARVANAGFIDPYFRVEAPFLHESKALIARVGKELKVPWEQTWSCYEGGEVHCGECGTCVERREALASVGDPTEYAA